MKKILFLAWLFPSVLFAVDKVQIANNGGDLVTITDQKIEVSSGSFFQLTSSGAITVNISGGRSGSWLSISTGTNKIFNVGSSSISVSSSVNVGLGADSISSKLDIVGGSVTIRGTNAGLEVRGGSVAIYGVDGGGNEPILQVGTGTLAGIGTRLFCVYRTSITLGVPLSQNQPFADYVFQPGYKLMPLNEVQRYVNKFEHLPNMPDAKVFEAGEVSVARTIQLMMEKLEEAYLYIFELNAKIKKLESK